MMLYINLYLIFFKVGLFTIGGGLAAIPLLQEEAFARAWVTEAEFADMIAISQSTPGPIGINMATYVGFNLLGAGGSIIATLGMVTPSIIIISLIAKFLVHFNDHPLVKGIFKGLRPAVIGIIASAAFSIALFSIFNLPLYKMTDIWSDFINIRPLIMFCVFLYATNKLQHHPIFFIVIAGVTGILVF